MNDVIEQKSSLIRVLTQWLPIVAFVAAAIYLWRSELAPEIQLISIPLILAASGVQLLAFTMRAWILRDFLKRFGIVLSCSGSIACIFKPILSKYIPGKVWLLVSTVGQLGRHGVPFKRGSIIISVFQVTLAISGLVLGAIALLVFQLPSVSATNRLLMISLPLVMLALLLGSARFLHWGKPLIARFGGRFSMPDDFPSITAPIFYAVLHWLTIGLAFTFFLLSVNVNAGWYPILFQPLAINLGVIAVFVPGGLGVREGAMAAYLALADIPLAYGISLAVAARIWFFAGEVAAFFIGMLVDRYSDSI